MVEKNVEDLPLDSDAEAAVPPCQQPLVRAGPHVKAEDVSGGRGFCFFSGALTASLVATIVLYMAVVFNVVAVDTRSLFRTEPIKVSNSSLGGAAHKRNVSRTEPSKVSNSSLGGAARKRNVSRTEPSKVNNSSLGASAHRGCVSCTEPITTTATTSTTTPSSLGVAVCILGQMSRLEIESKVQNIIKPLSNYTKVGVFLSLETDDQGVFFKPLTSDVAGTRCRGAELDVDGVKEAFAPYFRDGVFGPHVDESFSENVVLERWPKLYKYVHPDDTASDNAARSAIIASDFSQMRHQKQCAELIQKSEESAGDKYDVVVKVRDNTIALRPVAPEKLVAIREVTLKHCSWWGGVNDKVMALPRKYLEKSLGAIYPSMLAVMNDDPLDYALQPLSSSRNTEQLVMFTLARNKVPWRERAFEMGDRDGDDYLPFVDGRCCPSKEPGGEGRWCIVSHCKDCWPSMPWTYDVTCEVAVTGLEALPAGSSTPPSEDTPVEQTLADPDPERECRNPIFR